MASVVAERYLRWAELEAKGVSALYYDWAVGVAGDAHTAELIASLPSANRQPNLVFAASRLVGVPVGPYAVFRDWLRLHWAEVASVALSRSTQTNEAGRCAVLLPALARLNGPLSLIEAGTSAGLCLFPDRYSYEYDTGRGWSASTRRPVPAASRFRAGSTPKACPRGFPKSRGAPGSI